VRIAVLDIVVQGARRRSLKRSKSPPSYSSSDGQRPVWSAVPT
jgi:hypothetical protein